MGAFCGTLIHNAQTVENISTTASALGGQITSCIVCIYGHTPLENSSDEILCLTATCLVSYPDPPSTLKDFGVGTSWKVGRLILRGYLASETYTPSGNKKWRMLIKATRVHVYVQCFSLFSTWGVICKYIRTGTLNLHAWVQWQMNLPDMFLQSWVVVTNLQN